MQDLKVYCPQHPGFIVDFIDNSSSERYSNKSYHQICPDCHPAEYAQSSHVFSIVLFFEIGLFMSKQGKEGFKDIAKAVGIKWKGNSEHYNRDASIIAIRGLARITLGLYACASLPMAKALISVIDIASETHAIYIKLSENHSIKNTDQRKKSSEGKTIIFEYIKLTVTKALYVAAFAVGSPQFMTAVIAMEIIIKVDKSYNIKSYLKKDLKLSDITKIAFKWRTYTTPFQVYAIPYAARYFISS